MGLVEIALWEQVGLFRIPFGLGGSGIKKQSYPHLEMTGGCDAVTPPKLIIFQSWESVFLTFISLHYHNFYLFMVIFNV